ncbi:MULTISPECIES: hypothetical protein [Persicobacter]|uniref:Uncharacterized protein n=1 Tax=Persicobacter diffluens TaxID=981 RepID=A0AAN4VWM6_9BACT|nr:hypothetical protein [Persicobacter sp. CCB-QB2]GJM60376.1 hypothetical protein PEDI_09280 [Persicobacter diffluens]
MKNFIKNFLKGFQPEYSVVVKMYHVIPGQPVKVMGNKEKFGKGEKDAASAYFKQVLQTTGENKFMPVEVQLVKGKKVIRAKSFGPVQEIKTMKLAA